MKPWESELQIDADMAAALIAEQFPELAPLDVRLFGSGWDNTAFIVNGEFVFRFPRREFALPFFQTEVRVLGRIAPLVPLPIPRPLYIGEPSVDYPWPFAGYQLIPGRTACAANLSDDDRTACAVPLAHFLRALHAIPVDQATSFGVGPDTIGRLDINRRTARLRDDIVKIEALGVRVPLNWTSIAESVHDVPPLRTLVHGDLYIRHTVVDDSGAGVGFLSGVIDWGDCHIGHPAIDLAIVHSFLPPTAHSAFREAYGDTDEDTWTLARWRALQHTAMLTLFAHDVVDRDLIRECEKTFRYLDTRE